ncbi:hypothetical protein D3C78_1712000 [compost metagenome]
MDDTEAALDVASDTPCALVTELAELAERENCTFINPDLHQRSFYTLYIGYI